MRVLWVTNDLPPRSGGIQQFVVNLLRRVHPEATAVLGPDGGPRAAAHDAGEPYRTARLSGPVLPTPATRRAVIAAARDHGAEVVVLGASWPLGELAPALTAALGVPVVALSHGLEAGLVGAGGARLIGRATRGLAALTTISGWTEDRLRPHVRAGRIERIPPGVDVERFHPQVDGGHLRRAWGVEDGERLVVCLSRLVPRKGQDQLLAVWPQVRAAHPDARLALVGEGPAADRLARTAAGLGSDAGVVLPGRVAWDDLPAVHAAADLFAMPCRTRRFGTDVEGLGIVYLEAQAVGRPAIAGRSGGAPEAVLDGVTGSVVDGRDDAALVAAIHGWLADPDGRAVAGRAGREWVEQRWSWTAIAQRFAQLLDEVVADHSAGPAGHR